MVHYLMLITYCQNEEGQQRLYLTPHGSLEAWLEPAQDDEAWICVISQSEADGTINFDQVKAEPTRRYLLAALASLVGVAEEGLTDIPFHQLAGLATPLPQPTRRRMARARAKADERGWLIATPLQR